MGNLHFNLGSGKSACGMEGGGFARGLEHVDCGICRAHPDYAPRLERTGAVQAEIHDLVERLSTLDLRRFCLILWQRVPNDRKVNAIHALRIGEMP